MWKRWFKKRSPEKAIVEPPVKNLDLEAQASKRLRSLQNQRQLLVRELGELQLALELKQRDLLFKIQECDRNCQQILDQERLRLNIDPQESWEVYLPASEKELAQFKELK